jgi:hypothetical protein
MRFMSTVRFLILAIVFLITASTGFTDQVYNHVSGLRFQYPDGWSVKDSAFADFELIPPDSGSNELGATETYFQWEFLFEPSNQKIIENLEQLIPRVVPFLKRTGEVEQFQAGEVKGMLPNWNGTDPAGVEVWARVFVFPGKDMTIALVALGEKKRLDARESAIRSILSSYQFGPAEKDKTLFGQWGSAVQEPCGNGNHKGISEIKSSLQLNSSGSFQMSESGHSTGCDEEKMEENGDYEDTFDGTWFANQGKLFLVSSSNTSITFSYQVQGETGSRILTLNHGTGRSQVLNEKHP